MRASTAHAKFWMHLMLVLGFLVGGCTSASVPAKEAQTFPINTPKLSRRTAIGLILGKIEDGFFMTLQKSAMATAAKLGVDLIVDGPTDYSAEKQIATVNRMLAQPIAVLIIAPVNPDDLIEPLTRANEAGVKIITVGGSIGDGDYERGTITFPETHIGSDFVLAGKFACEALIKAMGSAGKMTIQEAASDDPLAQQREQGCRQAIQATHGQVVLVGIDYNNGDVATATKQTETVLQQHTDLRGVYSANAAGASGANKAAQAVGTDKNVVIAVFDATDEAIQDLRDQKLDLVIAQKPAEMGSVAVTYAAKLMEADGQRAPKQITTGFVAINRENVDSPEAQAAMYKRCHCSMP